MAENIISYALIAVDHFRLAILCALSCILLLRRITHAVVMCASADTVGLRGVCPGHRSLGRNLHSGRNAAVGQRRRGDFPAGQRAQTFRARFSTSLR